MIGESIFDWVIYGISILIFASALIEGKTTRYPALFFYGSLILMLILIVGLSGPWKITNITLITVSSWIIWRGLLQSRYIGMISIGYANSWIILRTRITPGNSCSGFITILGQSIRTWQVIRNIFRVGGSWPSICFHIYFC